MNKLIFILTFCFISLIIWNIKAAETTDQYLANDSGGSEETFDIRWSTEVSPHHSPGGVENLDYSNKYTDNPLSLGEPLAPLLPTYHPPR